MKNPFCCACLFAIFPPCLFVCITVYFVTKDTVSTTKCRIKFYDKIVDKTNFNKSTTDDKKLRFPSNEIRDIIIVTMNAEPPLLQPLGDNTSDTKLLTKRLIPGLML